MRIHNEEELIVHRKYIEEQRERRKAEKRLNQRRQIGMDELRARQQTESKNTRDLQPVSVGSFPMTPTLATGMQNSQDSPTNPQKKLNKLLSLEDINRPTRDKLSQKSMVVDATGLRESAEKASIILTPNLVGQTPLPAAGVRSADNKSFIESAKKAPGRYSNSSLSKCSRLKVNTLGRVDDLDNSFDEMRPLIR